MAETGFGINNADSGNVDKDVIQVWDTTASLVSATATELGFVAYDGNDLARKFVLYSNMVANGYTGVTGQNCNLMDTTGNDIGPNFVLYNTIRLLPKVEATGNFTTTSQVINSITYSIFIFTGNGTIIFQRTGFTAKFLAVGGGGGGGDPGGVGGYRFGSGGGGGGGVFIKDIVINDKMNANVTIGSGGRSINYFFNPLNGGDTTGVFSNINYPTITAGGGGTGGGAFKKIGNNGNATGGSGGGSLLSVSTVNTVNGGLAGTNASVNYNYSNKGGDGNLATDLVAGGGGGAGAVGSNATTNLSGNGGDGIQGFLTNSSGDAYYWGGGGGGGGSSTWNTTTPQYTGKGGKGGGGGLGAINTESSTICDTFGYNNSTANGGPNTGGGGCGNLGNRNPGIGGSGIFIVAVPNLYL